MKTTALINRRRFVRQTLKGVIASAAAPHFIPSSALGNAGQVSPSNRITVGCIGVGPRGTDVMNAFLPQKDAQVLAVCDVKSNVLKARQQHVNSHYKNKDCKAYSNFQELVDRKDIDAVLVATADHWHVLTSMAAVRSGKDVYMEKPMGLSIAEDQAMRKAVHEHGRIFQFGTQQRSSRNFRFACELALNGKIGDLQAINVWAPGSVPGGSTKVVPVPEWLDYNMWLGPAPETPYTEDRCSNKYWWFISDYALGFIAGWGVHPLDIALWGGKDKMTGPWEVEGKGAFPTEGVCDTATTWDVNFKFKSGLRMNYQGLFISDNTGEVLNQVSAFEKRYGKTQSHGTAFEGSEGWVHVNRAGINAHPKSLLDAPLGSGDTHLYKSNHHVRNFLDCVKSRKETVCPVDEAVRADTLCHVSDVAIRLGHKVTWDAEAETFLNDAQANERLNRAMRSPWRI